jgi:ClpP class serine protease
VPDAERRAALAELEAVRNSRVIAYILSDRPSFPTFPGMNPQIDGEALWPIRDVLRRIGKTPRIDLFLHTRGGATDAVWPMVSLIREYCEQFAVIVPFRAHSGGTMICLGADELLLLEESELSPIDPTTGNQFNPVDPTNPADRFGISVEDVVAYFQLAAERAGIDNEQYRTEVFRELANKVHPLALGNVQRVYQQIRRLAGRLLALHLDEETAGVQIERITKGLTEQFYSHVHAITRREAKELLGDWVHAPTTEEEAAIRKLFDAYADTLSLGRKYNLPRIMGDDPRRDETVVGGIIETNEALYAYETEVKILQRPNLPPNVQVQLPPGQQIPLAPWPSRSYDFGLMGMGWVEKMGQTL